MSGDTQEHKALSSKSGKELFKDLLNDVTVRAISALKEVISGKSPLEVTTMEAEINHCIMQVRFVRRTRDTRSLLTSCVTSCVTSCAHFMCLLHVHLMLA